MRGGLASWFCDQELAAMEEFPGRFRVSRRVSGPLPEGTPAKRLRLK
jgi:hypothetical protein